MRDERMVMEQTVVNKLRNWSDEEIEEALNRPSTSPKARDVIMVEKSSREKPIGNGYSNSYVSPFGYAAVNLPELPKK